MGESFIPKDLSVPANPENMAARVLPLAPATDAEALKLLRARFPDCPLSMRVAALDYITRHKHGLDRPYRPR